jgi:hypothetical protein
MVEHGSVCGEAEDMRHGESNQPIHPITSQSISGDVPVARARASCFLLRDITLSLLQGVAGLSCAAQMGSSPFTFYSSGRAVRAAPTAAVERRHSNSLYISLEE